MDIENIKGLSSEEVTKKRSLGLSNDVIDSYTPSKLIILRRNLFSLINIVVFPLLIVLAYYKLYTDVLAFSTFLIINTVISILDELRIKKQLEKLKNEFQVTVNVIRDGKTESIPTTQIVEGDYIKAREGEGIIADGEVVSENFLQLDESALNGESNYIRKYKDEKIYSGSYIVTGECVYRVLNVGKNNYLNKIGTEALKFREKKSPMQRNADKLILFLVFASISLGLLNFYATGLSETPIQDRVLGLTTIVTLIIPQTLIFLFTLTFTISITKLYNKGVLVQKGGSIEDLSNINVICFDKTGTITTNDMKIINVEYFNVDKSEIGSFYNSVQETIVGVNKTQEIISKYYQESPKFEIGEFDQIPFTSKNKYSLVSAKANNEYKTIVFGAFSMVQNNINTEIIGKIKDYIQKEEDAGNRILIGLYYQTPQKLINTADKGFDLNSRLEDIINKPADKIIVFTIEETLNPGIKQILEDLKSQSIKVKIISGDSLTSVSRVMQKLGLNTKDIIVDLSATDQSIEELVKTKEIFTRAKPEDKLTIIAALQKAGHKVAMVGDGINDVLSLKASDVSIAMEGGSKIAREVADIVLLKNDYSKIPTIFFEGENIIFNLKATTKMFFVKSFLAIIVGVYFTLNKARIPLDPSSTLIFSFLGSSAPSYVLVFTRQKVTNAVNFFREVLWSAIPSSILYAAIFIYVYLNLKVKDYSFIQINSSLVLLLLSLSIVYSLYLVWEAKKLKNIFLVAFVYILIMGIGTFQTLLPVNFNVRPLNEIIVMLTLMIIAISLLFVTLLKLIKPNTPLKKIGIALICIIILVVISFFPFQSYYNVTSVPADTLITINVLALITIPILYVIHLVSKKINFNK